MLEKFPSAYGITDSDKVTPDMNDIKAVLGKAGHGEGQYSDDQKKLFVAYHKNFKLGSKPVAHLNALANLENTELVANMPESLSRLVDAVISKIKDLPE